MKEEKNSLIYKILRLSFIYRTYQYLVIKKSTYKFIYQNIFKTNENSVVLDCGCGPAQYRKLIKCKKYIGIDFNSKHIQTARKNYPDDIFYEGDLSKFDFQNIGKVTDILLFGLLHHLNDENAKNLINNLIKQLEVTGQIIAIDPVYVKKENFYDSFANFIASKDQGNYVRKENEYRALVNSKLATAETIIYKNLLRIPFYHHILNIKI